ncbi:hypothetical protein SSP35_11_00790 [Streptomyces sp. NBRC 110611]|uniref:hypothetical protein n=1 Tax=Streptomyces sp. NBRC 110611 TaxID=1621259 RepID=UPI000832E000|nr:hypothetical protein [Streptomyces sp. NBRC 110611]GAU69260.1 hypothetical protein SSP35_11_00790 [Streptomyces sp. NBRC 110611]
MVPVRRAGGGPPGRAVAALCCWVLFLVVLLPLLVLRSSDARFGAALVVQGVVVVHTGGALARVLTDARARVIAFGFWLFSYVWLGLAPLAMLATDAYPRGFAVDTRTAFLTTVLVETGLLAYSAGSALASWRAGRAATVLGPVLARRLSPGRVLLLCGAALLLAAVLVPGQGGLSAFFLSRQAAGEAARAGSSGPADRALGAWVLSVPAFWALVALVHVPRFRAGDRVLRGLRWLLLPLLIALNVVVNNPISRPRFWAGTVLLTLLFGASWLRGARAFRVAAAGVAAVVLVVFPYSDYFRYDEREPVRVVSLAEQFTSNGDYDAFQQIATGVDRVRTHGFTPSAALGPPLFFVPRTAWPGKPDDAGILLARHAGYRFENLSAPLWIESYMWAGFPAVVAVFGLVGAVGRRIDDVRHRLRRRPGTLAALLVPAFGCYQLVLLRGSLMAIVGPLALLVCVPLLITRRSRRRPAVPSSAPESAGAPVATARRRGVRPLPTGGVPG